MARTGQPSREHVAATRRSLQILDLLGEAGLVGTNEIARRLELTPSTVSRQLGTLAEARLVEQDPGSGRYRLGIRVVELANAFLRRLDVRTAAHPRLEQLVAEAGETATLSVPGDPDAITVDVVAAQRQVQGVAQLGRSSIAHATAAGKVMLAFSPVSGRPPYARYTERTITDPDALAEELERVRRRGYAEAFGERELELNAIAAPVYGPGGVLVGIVALQGPAGRFGRVAARRVLPPLLEATGAISAELGGAEGLGRDGAVSANPRS